jgi:hypothetical protein
VWLECPSDKLISVPLALESEWKGDALYDFRKLIVTRCLNRVMMFRVPIRSEPEARLQLMKQQVESCSHSLVGDRYLFIWGKPRDRYFTSRVYLAAAD